MKAWWQHFSKALSPAECAIVTAVGYEKLPRPATVGYGGTPGVDENIRVSKTSWISRWEPRTLEIFHRLWLMGKYANANAFGLELDDFYECQFTVYDAENKGHYHKHIDNHWKPDPAKEKSFHRKMSMVVLLSDRLSYQGGRLELENDKLPDGVFTEQGDAIFFPAWNPHAVTEVTEGVRYSLVAWFVGPPLR